MRREILAAALMLGITSAAHAQDADSSGTELPRRPRPSATTPT